VKNKFRTYGIISFRIILLRIIHYIECIGIVGKYIFIIAALLYPRPYKRVCRGTVGGVSQEARIRTAIIPSKK
jgi:hypothetical protein